MSSLYNGKMFMCQAISKEKRLTFLCCDASVFHVDSVRSISSLSATNLRCLNSVQYVVGESRMVLNCWKWLWYRFSPLPLSQFQCDFLDKNRHVTQSNDGWPCAFLTYALFWVVFLILSNSWVKQNTQCRCISTSIYTDQARGGLITVSLLRRESIINKECYIELLWVCEPSGMACRRCVHRAAFASVVDIHVMCIFSKMEMSWNLKSSQFHMERRFCLRWR